MNDILANEMLDDKIENNSLLDLTNFKTEEAFKFYDKYFLVKTEKLSPSTEELFLEIHKYTPTQPSLKKSIHNIYSLNPDIMLENFCDDFKAIYNNIKPNKTTFSVKEAAAYAFWTKLKETTDTTDTFAKSSKRYINTLLSKPTLADKIDKDLFINLCLHTLFNEQKTNAQKTLMYNPEQLSVFLNETLRPEYLERFGKSAHRNLIENILLSCESPETFMTTHNFQEGSLMYCLNKSDFLETLPTEQLHNLYFTIFDHPEAFLNNLTNYEKSLLPPESKDNITPNIFSAPPKELRTDFYENYFLSTFTKSEFTDFYTNMTEPFGQNPNFVLNDNLKLTLVSKLPSFVKTLAYQAYYNSELLNDIYYSNTDLAKSNTPNTFWDELPYITDNSANFTVIENYILDSIRNDLIFNQYFSRKDVSNFMKDLQSFKTPNYLEIIKKKNVNLDII